MLDIVIYTPQRLVFQGTAQSLIVPGERGVFEVLTYHKPLVSRLISGSILVDGRDFGLRCGIIGVNRNRAIIVMEE